MRIAIAALLAMTGLAGATAALADEALKAKLQENLQKVLPDTAIDTVAPSALPGLLEVMVGAEVLYMTEDGRYVIKGDLFDLGEMRNVTETKRTDARAAALRSVPADSYIEFAPEGGAKHVLWVFTDIECGYCRKFHAQMAQINEAGIAVRYLAFPRQGLDSEDYRKTVEVWCAPDRRKAMTEAKAGKALPEANCENPVAAQYKLGQAMGVQGTPAVYLESGREIGGFIPAEALAEFFAQAPN